MQTAERAGRPFMEGLVGDESKLMLQINRGGKKQVGVQFYNVIT
jgi:hypothetical protein